MSRPPIHIPLTLFLIALVPRLSLALAYLHAPIGLDDMFQYDMLARSLATGNGYRWYARADAARMLPYLKREYGLTLSLEQFPPNGLRTTFRAPGYPFFLAALYALFAPEHRLAAARLVQTLLGAMLAPGTALLSLRLGHSRRAAFVAGGLVALYPILWMYPLGLASENLFLPLVLLSLILLLHASRTPRLAAAIAAGLSLGASTLTRGALALFLPAAALWLALGPTPEPSQTKASRRLRAARVAALTAAASIVILPWMLRNSLILGRPAFVETSIGYNLFVGYHPLSDGTFQTQAAVLPLSILDDGDRDRWTTSQAALFIRLDLLGALSRLPRRLAAFWGLEDRELTYFYANNYFGPIRQPWLALCYLVLVGPLIGLGLSAPWGMVLAPDRRGLALSLMLIGTAMLAYVPILAEPRYHLPLIPVLAAYAAATWTTPHAVRQLYERMHRRDPAAVCAATFVALLIVLWAWDFALDWDRLSAVMAPGGHRLGLAY